MNLDTVMARSAIESLRSGVPSRQAVAQLGTTQQEIKTHFEECLDAIGQERSGSPLVISANFGAGKSHLLEYLQSVAEQRRFVTSYAVVSPEMPLGNPHVVLKALAENAQAPGRTGKALRALAMDLNTASPKFAGLRLWARDANIDDRFRALLHIYEEFRADELLRTQILDDFEGKPLLKTIIRQKLKELGELSGYDLTGPKNALLAHDRIRLITQFYRACGCQGLVVFFDEVEQLSNFTTNSRVAAYQEIGWWREIAEQEGSGILPVFAMTNTFLQEFVTGGKHDEQRFQSATLGFTQDSRDQLGASGIDLLKSPYFLTPPTQSEELEVKYRIRDIYKYAYGNVPDLQEERYDSLTPIRSKIRRWITLWDLHRYYPEYTPDVEEDVLLRDQNEISDDAIQIDDGEENSG